MPPRPASISSGKFHKRQYTKLKTYQPTFQRLSRLYGGGITLSVAWYSGFGVGLGKVEAPTARSERQGRGSMTLLF